MSTNHIEPYKTFKIEKRDKECVLGIYRTDLHQFFENLKANAIGLYKVLKIIVHSPEYPILFVIYNYYRLFLYLINRKFNPNYGAYYLF